MAKNYKQSQSLLTRCFRTNKTIPVIVSTINSDMTTMASLSKTSPLLAIIETIQTIDQMVQATDTTTDKQKGDSPRAINIEQIEELLIKWTHIAHFLIDTYQQIQTSNEQS